MRTVATLAAVLTLSIAPAVATAAGTWNGWNGEHFTNLADPQAAASDPGKGDTRYCVNPLRTDCVGAIWTSPFVFTFVFVPTGSGCGSTSNPTSHPDYEPNPCDKGDLFGGFYVGTAPPDQGGVGAGFEG